MAGSSSLFFESGFIYKFWKPWESTPSHDNEGLSRRDHSEGVPRNKSGMKRSAVKTAQEKDCSLRIKDIIGFTQTNRAGLGSTSKNVFSKVGPKGKSDMVSEKVRMLKRGKEQPVVLLRPNNVIGQNGMISNH